LKVNRTSGLAYFHLVSIAQLQGNIARGFEKLTKPSANALKTLRCITAWLSHEEKGEIDMAIRNYSKAIMRDALRPDIRIRKARLLLQSNHIPEALQTLDETILTNPDVFEGYHLKFSILMQLKQYDKAEEVLKTAMDLFPKDPGFIIDKVTLFIEQKKVDEAFALLDELEKAEGTDDAVRRRIYMERAQIYATRDMLNLHNSMERQGIV
jgi:tetratricopeptide (TPR) repeat protein